MKDKDGVDPEESTRMLASASFVAILIIIGLPLWWKTTEVYRVTLPHKKISSLDSILYTITVNVKIISNEPQTSEKLGTHLQEIFGKHYGMMKLNVIESTMNDELYRTMNNLEDESAMKLLKSKFNVDTPNVIYLIQRNTLKYETWLSTERIVFFRNLDSAPTIVEVLHSWIYQYPVLEKALAARANDDARRVRFPAGSAYHVVMSVVHPRPDIMDIEFNARQAAEDYIGTFVDELAELHNITVKSQWLHFLDFKFQERMIPDNSEWTRHYMVRESTLPFVLTKLEERTATHVSEYPTINLVLFAIPCQDAPVIIYDDKGLKVDTPTQGFMAPKWGGVVIGYPDFAACQQKNNKESYVPNVNAIMGTFIAQLRPLLGFIKPEKLNGAYLEPLKYVKPRRWEIDAVMRSRTIEQLTSAKLTLQSLAQLLDEISNIVINDEVGDYIKSAVTSIESAHTLLEAGDLVGAYRHSQAAHQAAETAFTDSSLLALLYFPDDQKYAVYIPLFLPVMIPVIFSLRQLWTWLRGKPTEKEKID